ncbi:MAG TPA: serine/threonine-protein kinase, partial [Nannocystaceae bacterium]|nr:serine/threonine-protein kinase [Nannocystaceae bacterium]
MATSSNRLPTPDGVDSPLRTRTIDDEGGALATGDVLAPHRSPGARVGDYIVLELLGAGGMGVVYAAYDPQLDRKIALKVLRPDFDAVGFAVARARMIGEGRALARLSHPNVVAVHDVGSIGDEVYIAMELVEGQTLTQWRKGEGRTVADTIALFLAIADGLAAVHDAGLVHRDVKPDNVLVDRTGRARVTDFGLARIDRDSPQPASAPVQAPIDPGPGLELTRTGTRLGTPAYMACEQLRGEGATARSDQFGFCVSFWECLWGERPYSSESLASLVVSVTNGTIREPPQLPEGRAVPPWLRRILERGLQPDPEQRWPSMRELAAAIANGDPFRRRRRVLAWSAVGAAIVLGALGVTLARAAGHERALAECDRAAASVNEVWSADVRARVESAFAAADGADAAPPIVAALDRHVARWTELRRDACVSAIDERASELAP